MGIIQRLRYILRTELSNKKSVVAVGSPAARSSPVLPPSECTKQSMQQFLPRLPTNFPRHFLFPHNRIQCGTVLLSALLKAIPSTNPSSLITKLSDLCHPDTISPHPKIPTSHIFQLCLYVILVRRARYSLQKAQRSAPTQTCSTSTCRQ